MTGPTFAILLIVIGILVFCSALFSGLETALFALKPHQLRRLEANHAGLSKFISVFRENPRRVLNVLLLGDGLVNVLLVILCLFVLWRNPFAARVPQWFAATAIFAIVVLLCDLIPKMVALSAPYRLSAIGAFTLKMSMPLLDRVGNGLETFSTALVDLFTPTHLQTRQKLSDEELETIVEIGEEEGALHEAEAEMIQEIIKLGDKTAKDCMTPRVDTFMLPDDLTNEEIIARLHEKRHRRVPVYADTPDQLVGILDVKNFLLDPIGALHRSLDCSLFRAGNNASARSFEAFPLALAGPGHRGRRIWRHRRRYYDGRHRRGNPERCGAARGDGSLHRAAG